MLIFLQILNNVNVNFKIKTMYYSIFIQKGQDLPIYKA